MRDREIKSEILNDIEKGLEGNNDDNNDDDDTKKKKKKCHQLLFLCKHTYRQIFFVVNTNPCFLLFRCIIYY